MNAGLTERQQEIINVSLEIIAEGGIQSLTIKNLAKRIGFAESAIYRHYENKLQILMAILQFFRHHSENLYRIQLASEQDSISKLETLFQSYMQRFSMNPALVAVIFSEEIFRNEVELTQYVNEIMEFNLSSLQTIIEEGQAHNEIRNDVIAQYLSVMVLGSFRMFVKQWQMNDYQFNIIEKGEDFLNSMRVLLRN